MQEILIGAISVLISLILGGVASIFLLPKAILSSDNKALQDSLEVVRGTKLDLIAAITASKEVRRGVEETVRRQAEEIAALRLQQESLRLDLEWVRQEFYRVTGAYPAPRLKLLNSP